MAKKITSLMKKGRSFEDSYMKVWNSRKKVGGGIQTVWSNGQILVLNSTDLSLQLDVGTYRYNPQSGMIIKGKIPSFTNVIPNRKGYRKAEVVKDAEMLRLNLCYTRSLVTLKGNGVKAYIDYDYYSHLTDGFAVTGEQVWKVKGPKESVLFYRDKELVAIVAPVDIEDRG